MIQAARTSSQRSPWLVGKDREGHWVVRDQAGLNGGIFANRNAALHFALLENGHGPQAAIMVPDILELDMAPRTTPRPSPRSDSHVHHPA